MSHTDRSIEIIRQFTKGSFGTSNWEYLISRTNLRPYGCLIDALDLQVPVDRRDEVAFYASQRLRRDFPCDPKKWQSLYSDDGSLAAILSLIQDEVLATVSRARFFSTWYPTHAAIGTNQRSGFTPWTGFGSRQALPDEKGVYLFAYFPETPPANVDPLDDAVIYVGMTTDSIRLRLEQFEQTAHGCSGHSAGWKYRTKFTERWAYAERYGNLEVFFNTYVSWQVLSSPRDNERTIIAEFQDRHGRKPFLNRNS